MSSTVKKDILKYSVIYFVLLVFAYIAQFIYLSSIYSFSSQWVDDTWSNTWWVPIPLAFAFLFLYFIVDYYLLLSDVIVRSLIIGVIGLFFGMSIYQLTPAVSSSTNTSYSDCYNTLTKNLPKNSSGHYGDSGCQLSYDAKVEVFSADVVKEDKDVVRDGVKGSSYMVKNRRITSDADSIDTWPRGTANGTAIFEDQGEWKIFLPYVGSDSVQGDRYVDNFVVDDNKLIRYDFGRVTAQPNRMSSFCYKNLKYESDYDFKDFNGFHNPNSDDKQTVEYKVTGTCTGDSNVVFELR